MAQPLSSQKKNDHPMIGQTYTAMAGLTGRVVSLETTYCESGMSGRRDIPVTHLLIEATQDSPYGHIKKGTRFSAYTSNPSYAPA